MAQRPLRDWLDEDVELEELDAGGAAIEEARQVAQPAAQRPEPPPDAPEAGEAPQTPPEANDEPVTVRAVRRLDPILPVVQSVREHPAREAGRLAFVGGLADGRGRVAGQLPMLPDTEGPRVPLLDLIDYRGGPVMAKGRGAPLDLRLFVGACIMAPFETRKHGSRLAVTQRELRDFLFPNRWQRNRDWPAIQSALRRAHTYEIPGRFTWRGGTVVNWVPFRLVGGAGDEAALDDLVVIDVELPPRSAAGPVIDRRTLAQLGVTSAPRFRAYIAAHSVAWRVGVTRRRHPLNRRVHLWSADPAHYPILTTQDRRRLAFGGADTKHRLTADQNAAWEKLPGVEVLSRAATTQAGRNGWVIVPEAAAEAIRKAREEGDNRRTGGT